MKTSRLGLLGVAFGMVLESVHAAPIVLNPSFESNSIGGNGYGAIDNWAQVPNPSGLGGFPFLSGVNTSAQPFWDNGTVPGAGTTGQVGFIQVFPSVPTLSLLQTVAGFDTTRTYQLSYFENSRATTSAPFVEVLVDGQIVVAQHLDTAVDPAGTFATPFRTVDSLAFTVSGTSADVEFRVSQVNAGDDATATIDGIVITDITPVPETSHVLLAAVGALAVAGFARRRYFAAA